MAKRVRLGPLCVALLLLSCVCSDETQPVTCTIPSVTKGQTATLTCDFGTDMRKLQSNISVERGRVQSEDLVKCYWREEDYSCSILNQQFSMKPNISRYLQLFLPNVDQKAEQQYLCRRHGHRDFPNACKFTLKGEEDDLDAAAWKNATIALIVLLILALIPLICMIIRWCSG